MVYAVWYSPNTATGAFEALQAVKNHLEGWNGAMGFLHLDLKKVKHLPGSLMLSRWNQLVTVLEGLLDLLDHLECLSLEIAPSKASACSWVNHHPGK